MCRVATKSVHRAKSIHGRVRTRSEGNGRKARAGWPECQSFCDSNDTASSLWNEPTSGRFSPSASHLSCTSVLHVYDITSHTHMHTQECTYTHAHACRHAHTHMHTHVVRPSWLCPGLPVRGWTGTRTNLDVTEARDSEWQWHHLGHMQICTSPQTDNHASIPPLSFYRPDALPAAQTTASKR